jgi:hypothetical protein
MLRTALTENPFINQNMKASALVLAALALTALSARAQFTEIDITGQTSANLQGYTLGFNYPLGGAQINVNGVPFGIATEQGMPGTTGIVQSPDLGPENFPSGLPGAFSYSFPVPANTHATALYTLINSAYGEPGTQLGMVTVTGTGGETAVLNLIEGGNVRDHNNDGFDNTVSDPNVASIYFLGGLAAPDSPSRLDRQVLDLPATFAGDTIASITFSGDAAGYPGGDAFLAGVTLGNGTVPDNALPLPVILAALGLVALSHRAIRRPVTA